MNHESVVDETSVRQAGVAPQPTPHSTVRGRQEAQPENIRSHEIRLNYDSRPSWRESQLEEREEDEEENRNRSTMWGQSINQGHVFSRPLPPPLPLRRSDQEQATKSLLLGCQYPVPVWLSSGEILTPSNSDGASGIRHIRIVHCRCPRRTIDSS